MLNINILRPNQIPHTAGLIGFVNDNGDIGVMSATRGTGEMRYDMDKANRKAELVKSDLGLTDSKWRGASMEKKWFFKTYPESIYRLVFWEMDYELADSLRRKFTKNQLLSRNYDEIKGAWAMVKESRIKALLKQVEELEQTV
jgi:hypothetical protein